LFFWKWEINKARNKYLKNNEIRVDENGLSCQKKTKGNQKGEGNALNSIPNDLYLVEGREEELGICQILSKEKIKEEKVVPVISQESSRIIEVENEYFVLRTAKRVSQTILNSQLSLIEKLKEKKAPRNYILLVDTSSSKLSQPKIEHNSFPLVDLTKALWPDILMNFSTEEVSQLCQSKQFYFLLPFNFSHLLKKKVCKEFNKIVNTDAHWKKRSKRELTNVDDVDRQYDGQSRGCVLPWKEFYKRNQIWTITVHVVQFHWGSYIDHSIKVKVSPWCTVHEFLEKCKSSLENRETCAFSFRSIKPFKKEIIKQPSVTLGGIKTSQKKDSQRDGVANCEWNVKSKEDKISMVGLCNGAVLSHPSRRRIIG
jgi:hypothetical protein